MLFAVCWICWILIYWRRLFLVGNCTEGRQATFHSRSLSVLACASVCNLSSVILAVAKLVPTRDLPRHLIPGLSPPDPAGPLLDLPSPPPPLPLLLSLSLLFHHASLRSHARLSPSLSCLIHSGLCSCRSFIDCISGRSRPPESFLWIVEEGGHRNPLFSTRWGRAWSRSRSRKCSPYCRAQ